MNAFSPDDFGETADLLRALGLVGSDGEFNSDWLGDPEAYLKTMLADDTQRQALFDFVATMRGGETERDAEDRLWIELFSEDLGGGSQIGFFVVADDTPVSENTPIDEVHLFLGVRFNTSAPLAVSQSALMFPLFRAAKSGPAPSSPELIRQRGGFVAISSEVTVSDTPAPPGEARLQAVGLRLLIPTFAADGDPKVGLSLRGLQLPGEATGRDLTLSLTDPDSLRDAGLELIIGLLQAKVGTAAGAQIQAFAKLIGLDGDPVIPSLPVEDIFNRGLDAFGDWLAQVLGDAARRAAWLQALADVFGGGATVQGHEVLLTVDSAVVRIGLRAEAGASGKPTLTLTTAFGLRDGPAEVSLRADLVRVDLGLGTAVAVPNLRAEARFDLSGVVMPDVSVDTLVVGFGLNAARRPVLVLELLDVTLFSTTHPRLDLTNPEALAATAAQAITDALSEVLGTLGPAGDLIAIMLGWQAPPGASAGYPRIDLLEFLGDPLGRLRAHWEAVLNSHIADVPAVLSSLRELLTGDATPGAVTGSGTDAAPWVLPLVAGLHVAVWRDAAARLVIGLGFLRQIDTLGERCTVLETRVRAGIVALDLDSGAAGFLPEVSVRALGRARGGGRLRTDQGGFRFEVDHLGLRAGWTPDTGLDVGYEAPKPAIYIDGLQLPIDIPDFSGGVAQAIASITNSQWDALERLLAHLAQQIGQDWLNDLIEAVGWRRSAPVLGDPRRHRLRLAELISDTENALRSWLARILADAESKVEEQLQPLARFLSGRPEAQFNVSGTGTITDPWRIKLSEAPNMPAIAVWRQPDAPLPTPNGLLSLPLRRWRPGDAGLEPGKLAQAILSEFSQIAGPFGAGLAQDAVSAGLHGLAGLWQGSDGQVRAPAVAIPGATVHLIQNQTAAAIFESLDLAPIVGAAPATRINVQVIRPDAPMDPALDPARVLDMREAGRDPLAFTPLSSQAGTWHLLLAPRDAARLPSGDADGVAGQVARLRHGLSLMAARPDVTVVADAAAAHACWLALDAMGSGINRLVTIGQPVVAEQVPLPLPAVEAEMLRRLAEFMPEEDAGELDDDDLARARRLIAGYLGDRAMAVADLALPAGWTGTKRGDLALHLVYGALDADTIRCALSATVASGLSLNAQTRSTRRELQEITSASLGAWVPLSSAPAATGLVVQGHGLAEIVGVDLEFGSGAPAIAPRQARTITAALELRHSSGWLIGGPQAAPLPLDLELRSIEIDLSLTLGGAADPALNRAQITLHGVRIHDRSFPRLVLSPGLADGDLGIEGLAAPSTPEIQDLLSQVFTQLATAADPALAKVADALRAAGVLGAGDGLDPLSLSNWLDDPAARLQDLLADPALRNRLMTLIADITGDTTGISFDPVARQMTVTLSGATGMPVFSEWAVSGKIGQAGVTAAALRLGAEEETHVNVPLAPFAATLHLGTAEAEALGGLPPSVPLWPAPDVMRLAQTAFPAMATTALARILEGVRQSDPGVRPIIDAALTGLGLLDSSGGTPRVVIPPLMFLNPGAWLRRGTVLGTLDGKTVQPDRVIALIDALKPLVGLSGAPGTWEIAPGIGVRARNASGLVLEFTLDPTLFMPAADVDFGGAVGIHIDLDGRVLPAIAVFVGLSGGTVGQRAVHLSVASGAVSLFMRDGAGTDLEIYPNPAGLAQLATAGVTAALPAALDAIVATNTPAGNLIADIGDALLLRQGGNFDGPAMVAWVTDPAGTLETRWPQLMASGLLRLDDALPDGVSVVPLGVGPTPMNAGARLEIADAGTPGSTLHVTFHASPISVEVGANILLVPFANTVSAALRFDATGVAGMQVGVGPATIPLGGGIELYPVFALEVGSTVAVPSVSIGLAVDPENSQALTLRYDFETNLTPGKFDLGFGTNTPDEIASGIMHFAIDLVGTFLLELPPVREVLDKPIGAPARNLKLEDMLTGVLLKPGGGLDADFFRVILREDEEASDLLEDKLARVITLIDNIADAEPTVTIDGALDIGLAKPGGVVGFSLSVRDRLPIVEGDIALWLENDSRWIIGGPTAGLKIGLLKLGMGGLDFEPTLSVDGVGLRIGRSNAPLLDSPIAIGSIALHGFARLSSTEKLGGAQVQLSDLAVAVGGETGSEEGGNAVAEGMLAETNEGDAALAPAFSPAFSVQSKPGGDIAFRFSAGDGDGPWWLPIRSQFGPIYIDQIGLGSQIADDTLQSISLLFDGNVSIAGLQAAVDDLELRYRLDSGGIFDPASWAVDLAGLAVSADMSGVVLAGGLRKFETDVPVTTPTGTEMVKSIDYIGMLAARFGTYGLSLYGGYSAVKGDDPYTAFFVYGAVLGPIGGAPAFFLTGIGGGFGINRDLIPPTSPGDFDEFIMIQALDPAFSPGGNLSEDLMVIRGNFPAKKGKFWFAAGISFTSFALVDGIAVVAVEFGQGFELSIFGLARMALPRPEVALVSIELGLLARFSTEEGVIWIQAQLTDNSWLLHKSARLTGGFAYVSWFKGDKAGQFVLTLGGYHPSFQRDGYPVVPRLGFNWSVSSNIVIKSETYFALTSEAIMAGGLFEASAKFGPAFAHLSFGGNAIVYFDPFSYEADAHARVSAGIRIKTFLGTIKLSFSLGAYIEVRGPEFHGTARVEVGPIDIRVRFGDSSPVPAQLIAWTAFAEKYLELAPGNRARAMSGIAGKGAIPPASEDGDEAGSADGSIAHPFDVTSEFELSFTSTIPLTGIDCDGIGVPTGAKPNLGVAPSGKTVDDIILTMRLTRIDGGPASLNAPTKIFPTARQTGKFPIGVWGPPQDTDAKKLPKGDVISATEGIDISFKSVRSKRIPNDASGGVAFEQVEPGDRKPLPLRAAGSLRAALVREAQEQRALLNAMGDQKMPRIAADWHGAARQPTAKRSWARERAAPMRVGLLSERIVGSAAAGRKRVVPKKGLTTRTVSFGKARLRGYMVQPSRAARGTAIDAVTKVTRVTANSEKYQRIAPPVVAGTAQASRTAPVLLRAQIGAPKIDKTLVAAATVPETLSPVAAFSAGRTGAGAVDRKTLAAVENMVQAGAARHGDSRALNAGEIAVYDLPGANGTVRFPTAGELSIKGAARLVVIGAAGQVILNQLDASRVKLPSESRSFAVLAGEEPAPGDIAGWLETTQVAYLGRGMARCSGGFVRAEGASRARAGKRAGCGWMQARDLTDQTALVETSFDRGAQSLAIMIEGTVDPADLETLAVHFDGIEASDAAPQLVPFDGKTLIVYSLNAKADRPFSVSLGGRTDDRLDGIIAGRITADQLIARLLNNAIRLDLETLSGQSTKTVTAAWKAPGNLRVTQAE
ncbi:DUF6603 domain-containing protein [uncultured Roseobacter sp.]|uniref:DUF6603 domain-containing protein n=1 Tax=uncultured Roseobacter sp. TaxID=114847 RepID=UPI00260D2369|nr:DUF6603 domain-containing protein [uncultured Roseobacter sp.]